MCMPRTCAQNRNSVDHQNVPNHHTSTLQQLMVQVDGQKFEVHMDTSGLGLGPLLSQTQGEGSDKVISYASRTLSKG